MKQAPDFSDIIAEGEAYCALKGIKLSTLSSYAVGSSRWFDERKAGKPCLTTTIDRLRQYMRENPPAPTEQEAGAA